MNKKAPVCPDCGSPLHYSKKRITESGQEEVWICDSCSERFYHQVDTWERGNGDSVVVNTES